MLQNRHDDVVANAPSALPIGTALLQDPALNKGTAFTEAERETFHLRGLLPPHVSSQEQQLGRVLENFRRQSSDLEKYINLRALHDRNEVLFFRLLMDHPDEMMPIVYTPTVGLACQRYTHIFQRPHGIFVSAADRGRGAEVLANRARRVVALTCLPPGRGGTGRSSSSATASASWASGTWAQTGWAFPSASSRSTPL